MAVIKAVSSKAGIGQALDYVTKEEKTEEKLVSGLHCEADTVKDEMQATKELWGKTGGRTYKHFVQSYHDASLSDEMIIQPAIMMHFISIYELFRGIQEQNDIEALSLFSKEETQTLYRIRNIALYEYEKIDFSMIKIAIESHLPKIRQNILMLN